MHVPWDETPFGCSHIISALYLKLTDYLGGLQYPYKRHVMTILTASEIDAGKLEKIFRCSIHAVRFTSLASAGSARVPRALLPLTSGKSNTLCAGLKRSEITSK